MVQVLSDPELSHYLVVIVLLFEKLSRAALQRPGHGVLMDHRVENGDLVHREAAVVHILPKNVEERHHRLLVVV